MSIHVVGIGLDGAGGLSDSLRQLVGRATLLVGTSRHLDLFTDHPAPRLILGDLAETVVQMRPYLAASDPQIVIFTSGDPLFFGLGRFLLQEFPPEQLTFHPHLSSVQLAFSRLKVPWQDAQVISAHGRSFQQVIQALQRGVEKIALLTDANHSPAALADLILGLDLPLRYRFYICENLGGERERVQEWPLAEVTQRTFAPLNVVILLRSPRLGEEPLDLASLPCLGVPDQAFLSYPDRPGLMTKREVRLLILGELSLQPGQVVWDIGAGSGSVAIEIARLFSDSQVYAVEKSAVGSQLIEQNCRRFQVQNVISVHGSAPDILHRLRPPDRIFIGGSGGNLTQILGICGVRLGLGGTLVLALSTLEHLQMALEWIEQKIRSEAMLPESAQRSQWRYRVLQVQLSRSVPVSQLTRFAPLNPVMLLTIQRN